MCLNKVDKKLGKCGTHGYKVVWNDNGVLKPEIWGEMLGYEVGEWITDTSPTPNTIYPMGFHIFMSFKQAKRWADIPLHVGRVLEVREVQFKDVVCTGLQRVDGKVSAKVIVARKMLISPTVLHTYIRKE